MSITLYKINFTDNEQWSSLLDIVYPIGSVYISYTSESPANRFGGTWSAITGRFPYFNAGTTAGGENTHNHIYGVSYGYWNRSVVALAQYLYDGKTWENGTIVSLPSDSLKVNSGLRSDLSSNSYNITVTGSYTTTSSESNMPAYQTFYAWRRTD